MLTRLTIYGFLISWLCGFLLATTFIPEPVVDTTPVIHVEKQITYDKQATFTAYNAVPEQTDATPCTTASGYDICVEGPLPRIVATNLYEFGTILDIEGYGRYEVQDRTARKYGTRIDMLFKTREEAIAFGKKELRYRVTNPTAFRVGIKY